ncbi:flagellar hook-length control protein FliK [Aliagarivorans marinus]|uniref:flagellar hook-length control protein FliK n=1 Tax=Aliagarivorans marinus TaxID=561965 RepID=UPI0003FC2B3C|nr:flagellar hook-length control protein FliK [Aliagarivorans marinus]
MDLLLTQVSPSNGVESVPGNELPGSGGDSGFKELLSQQGGTSSDKPSATDTAKSAKGQSEQVETESSAKADAKASDAKASDDSKATSQSASDSQSPARAAESNEQAANQASQPTSDISNAGSDSGAQASSEVEGLLSQLRASEAMANELADAKQGNADAIEGEDDKQLETLLAKVAQGGDSEGESAEEVVDEGTKGTLGQVIEADADSTSDEEPDVAVDTENTEVVLDAGKGKPEAGDSELEEGEQVKPGEQPIVAGDVPAEQLPEGEQADTENADEATQALAKGEQSGAVDAQNQSQNPAVAGSSSTHAPAEGEGDSSTSSTKTTNAVGEPATPANSSSAAAQTAANNPVSADKPDADATIAATKGLEKGSEAELKQDGLAQAKLQGQLNEAQTGRDLGKVQLGESVVAAKASSEGLSDSKAASEGKLNVGKELAAASALGMAATSAQDGGEKSGEFGQQSQHAAHANALASAQQPVSAPETAATRGFVDHLSQAGEARGLHQTNQASANQAMPERFNPALINAGEELNQRVQMMLGQGLQRAEIRLDPAELGSMQIRVQVTNNDQASVQIQVQNPQAREALEQSMPRLREMLQQQGIELGQTQVNHQKDQQQHAHSDGRPEWAQGGEGAAGEFDDGEATSVDVAFNAAEGIDYYA